MAEKTQLADLPFVVDYAKSGRARCRRCNKNIEFNHLRLGRMVQSPYFDGMQSNWYHFRCFWRAAENKMTSVNDIASVEALRWHDQEKIREYVNSFVTKPWIDNRPDFDPGDEYMFSNSYSWRSYECSVCQELVASRESSIARRQPVPDGNQGQATVTWYHVPCFARPETLASVNWKDTYRLEMINGLEPSEVERIQGMFPKVKRQASETPVDESDSKTTELVEQYKEKLKAQSDFIWKVRDDLQKQVTIIESLQEILRVNNQEVPFAESALLDRVTECLVFGPPEPCTECDEGQLVLSTGGYRCQGNMSAWTKCTVFTQDVKRRKLFVPDCLEYFWPEFRYKPYNGGKRIFSKDTVTEEDLNSASTSTSPDLSDATTRPRPDPTKPLFGLEVASAGKLSIPISKVKETISRLGGTYTTKVKVNTVCVISTKTEVDWKTPKIMQAMGLGVHVVSQDFLTELEKGGDFIKLVPEYNIVPWGNNVQKRISNIDPFDRHKTLSTGKSSRSGYKRSWGYQKGYYKKRKYSNVKDVAGGVGNKQWKGGAAAAVDPHTGLANETHILNEDGQLFNATLGVADAITGSNTYYKIQLLESYFGTYWLFRAWGRVGTESGGNRLWEFGEAKSHAQKKFKETYFQKTGNQFGSEKFEKVPGKFFPVDIDYREAVVPREEDIEAFRGSRLPSEIQHLMKLICDINLFKIAMAEFEIDLNKMPLGKLSKPQIQNAYSVLTELQTLIETGDASRSAILDATNRFYTFIPHNLGFKSIPLLDTLEVIQEKTKMLDNLLEIEAAYNLLVSTGEYSPRTNPVDVHYAKLRCAMEVVPKHSDEFKMIETYTKNTHGATHDSYQLKVEEVFRLDREGEFLRFQPFASMHNRMLLWHGSRLSNFCGILSQGLRIAPPEAPKTGYMFGKGVYFADMVSKSANYCTTGVNSTGLMLLCEVAVGNMHELKESSYITQLPADKHSTKGQGKTCPDPSGQLVIENGIIVPTGQPVASDVSDISLQYNEYIVYDVAQIRMKYLIKMHFCA
ncbi:poly [ADP-ribose] polymerase 1-like [Patiria miniata]|uniref:Poly [ADP-ribose] polymerase n=1 Tax=Patiria miniata TaxID=46514 RepID=A0A913Z7Z5_PATMI|nr:poly [ADP-ribose] polymerase 1-like [Patiria miniata]